MANTFHRFALCILVLVAISIGIGTFLIDPAGVFTITANSFTRTGWNQLENGASKNDVMTLLGEPFMKVVTPWNERANEIWYYSRKSPIHVFFQDYRVYFDKGELVSIKTSEISEDCKVSRYASPKKQRDMTCKTLGE